MLHSSTAEQEAVNFKVPGSNPGGAAKENMKTVLVTSFDYEYMQYSYVFVKTLSENYSGKDVLTLYCLVPEDILHLEDSFLQTLGTINNLDIHFICSDKFVKFSLNENIHGHKYISKNAWHRIFIPSVCSDFDKVIYIDSDTIILRDIDPILNFPMHNKFNAFIENDPGMSNRLFRNMDSIYFNAGVFIADLKYWIDSGIEDKMISLAISGNYADYLDQDMLNLFFNDVFAPLPITFNYPCWYDENHEVYIGSPIVAHFVGNVKPWRNHKSSSILPEKWRRKHMEITGIDVTKEERYYYGPKQHG